MSKKSNFIKKSFALLTLFGISAIGYSFYIESSFEKYQNEYIQEKNSCEIWSHRGIVSDSLNENSIEAFSAAKKLGVTGIEIDVFWIDSLQSCVVMHDMDTSLDLRQALDLRDILFYFKDSLTYWIDLKNLTMDNSKPVREYFVEIDKNMREDNSKTIIHVESSDANALTAIKTDAIQTIYWIQFNRKNPLKKWLKLKHIKRTIYHAQFDGYSIAFKLYDEVYQNHFGKLPTYMFHGTYKEYEQLCAQKLFNIKAVLVDQDYYQLERD